MLEDFKLLLLAPDKIDWSNPFCKLEAERCTNLPYSCCFIFAVIAFQDKRKPPIGLLPISQIWYTKTQANVMMDIWIPQDQIRLKFSPEDWLHLILWEVSKDCTYILVRSKSIFVRNWASNLSCLLGHFRHTK